MLEGGSQLFGLGSVSTQCHKQRHDIMALVSHYHHTHHQNVSRDINALEAYCHMRSEHVTSDSFFPAKGRA